MPSAKKILSVDPEAHLNALLESGKIPHALLFAGPDTPRLARAARDFAAKLFCPEARGGKACGACGACRLLAGGNHPDARWTAPEDSGVIKIDAVREFIREAAFKPFRESRRVFVIERAHAMNEHAQNALLKTLEEPPGPSHFILLSEAPEHLLPTVRSRAQKIFFPSQAAPEEAAETEEAARKEALDALFDPSAKIPDWAGWERAAVLRVLEALLNDLRDVLVISAGVPALSRADHRPFKERAARETDPETLLQMLETMSSFKESIRQNSNLKLALAVLWDELRACRNFS